MNSYGQMPGMMGQQQMMPGMMGQQQMMPGMMAQPMFKQISVGAGIDMNEFNKIVQATTAAFVQKMAPISTNAANMIKNNLGGEWFVINSQINDKDCDFALTSVSGGDFLSFSLDNTVFQVCRLK